jgi:hypothetical protein
MKKFLFIILVSAIAGGCKKEKKMAPTPGLFGTWEIRHEYGGIAGVSVAYPPGNGHEIQFNPDSTFKMLQQLNIINQGTFSIVKNGIIVGTSKFDAIYFNHNTASEIIRIKADTLSLGNDFPDAMTAIYVKQ